MGTTTEQVSKPSPTTTPPPREPVVTPPAKSTMRKKIIIGVVVIAAAIALTWAIKTFIYSRAHETTDNAQVDGHIVPVLAKVGGYVTAVLVQDNDSVRNGQTLVRIDDAEYRVKVAQAEADLAAAQSAAGGRQFTGQSQAAVATASGQRSALDAQIQAALANQQKANADLARMRDLVSKQIVSAQQLDAAQAAAAAASADVEALQRQAAAAGGTVQNAQAGVRLAQARLEAAQASLENANLQLSYTNVTAPETGTISKKQVEVGQLVQPGQTLMSIVADTGTWVTANFKETQLNRMHVGQPVALEVDAYSGCEAEGKVQSLSGATGARFALLPPDNATGNFTKVVQRLPVRIAITKGCGATHPLRPGMSVVAHTDIRK
ncbi:MAG TPA: HlyD family secretion protein [Gemmatimonadaceae bacterium]|nr:HlyD family secretion protein [Gemmatimonadaceae bacterium]